ncbi:unnamed protein product [Schistosoma intercalatum]|nr:unnamed protein product [Schistosoma intercalatum]CAH8598435.1 unnamed protein product [Schistosoma intercalatum]
MLEYYGLCKCQTTKEQFNLHGRNHKLKDDNHDFRGFEQPLLKHKRDNTLQQYVERYVKQCNPSITLTKKYFNNTLSVNISDNKDIKRVSVNNRSDEAYKDESNTNSYTVTTEVPPETTSYMLDHGRCECIC